MNDIACEHVADAERQGGCVSEHGAGTGEHRLGHCRSLNVDAGGLRACIGSSSRTIAERHGRVLHAERTGRATLAGAVRTLQAGGGIRVPHLRLELGRALQGACRHSWPRPPGSCAIRETPVQLSRYQQRAGGKYADQRYGQADDRHPTARSSSPNASVSGTYSSSMRRYACH